MVAVFIFSCQRFTVELGPDDIVSTTTANLILSREKGVAPIDGVITVGSKKKAG